MDNGGARDSSSSTTAHMGDSPAVGKTSRNRVNRVLGSSSAYSGDFSNQQGLSQNSNETETVPMNNRALALKNCAPPSRKLSQQFSIPEEEPANIAAQAAQQKSENSNRRKNEIGDFLEEIDPAEEKDEDSSDETRHSMPSMGATSLKVLVRALVQQGKTQYLVIRNCLQTSEYFGRALNREEKQIISDILQEVMNENDQEKGQPENANGNAWANKRPVKRTYSRGGSNKENSKPLKAALSRQNSRNMLLRQNSKGFRRQGSSGRPPLSRGGSRGYGHGVGLGEDRLSLSERMSTTDRLSLTAERLSLSKQPSRSMSRSFSRGMSSGMITDEDVYGYDEDMFDGEEETGGLLDEPMRVSDCLAPVWAP